MAAGDRGGSFLLRNGLDYTGIGAAALVAAEFSWYEAIVRDYGYSWWKSDAAAREVLDRAPARLALVEALSARRSLVETSAVYLVDPVSWDDDRPALHAAIVDGLVAGVASPSEKPVLAVTMGVPGSGKSTSLRPLAADAIGVPANIVDADAVRERFPEFRGGYGSEVVQTETVFVTYGELLGRVRATGSSTIIDTVGNIAHLRDYRGSFPDHEIHLLCSEIPIDEAVARTQVRAIQFGRYVSEKVVRAAAGRPRAAFDLARSEGIADEWALVDTAVAPPTVLEASALYGPAGRQLIAVPPP